MVGLQGKQRSDLSGPFSLLPIAHCIGNSGLHRQKRIVERQCLSSIVL